MDFWTIFWADVSAVSILAVVVIGVVNLFAWISGERRIAATRRGYARKGE